MSDNLGLNTKNVVTMLGIQFAPIVVIALMVIGAYCCGVHEATEYDKKDCDCRSKSGQYTHGQCVKEIK
jgi:hypothetical protein